MRLFFQKKKSKNLPDTQTHSEPELFNRYKIETSDKPEKPKQMNLFRCEQLSQINLRKPQSNETTKKKNEKIQKQTWTHRT